MSLKSRKVRSSKKFCEEKFSCQEEKVEAEYECEECKSLQCAACENKLHTLAKFVFHDRKRLELPTLPLCQLSCNDRNYADVSCNVCELKYCNLCFEKMHSSGKRKTHTKIHLTDAITDPNKTMIKQNSSTGKADPVNGGESLDFVSLNDDDSIGYKTGLQDLTPINVNLPDITPEISNSKDSSTGLKEAEELVVQNEAFVQSNGTNDLSLSFLLVDQDENIQVISEEDFVTKLSCETDSMVKVVSIFGNTGDGKSHTLNHTFFGGKEVFKTFASQVSCTVGVWAAYDPQHNAILLDTEGLLGISSNQNKRTRLLLKVMAISDVVIYRTQADRLHNDMFHFLGDASKAYLKHFLAELKAASKRCKMDVPVANMGPAVVVFHETRHTNILGKGSNEAPDVYLRKRFQELDINMDAFCALQYVGTKTSVPPTNFKGLQKAIQSQLSNTNVRSSKKPSVIYTALKVLNEKFNGDIEKVIPNTFPDEYFTCSAVCLSCSARCTNTMNHIQENIPHNVEQRCKYQHQYDNKIFQCKVCLDRGQNIVVVPKTSESNDSTWFGLAKYAWAGYVLECPSCGIIFRSRQYWYGNEDPEKSVVRTEIRHVWPGGNPVLQGTQNAARRLLDSLNYATDSLSHLSAKPAKFVGNWVTDQIAPEYWVPNSQIIVCRSCGDKFSSTITIHHCRSCGQGFCDECSSKKKPVPHRGWGSEPVRVCDSCYAKQPDDEVSTDVAQTRARKYGELIGSAVGTVVSAIDYPKDVLLESARPSYWVPDHEIRKCCVCPAEFTNKLLKHHCRSCGQGVCDDCSTTRKAVPSRGWDHPVRVCNNCAKKKKVPTATLR